MTVRRQPHPAAARDGWQESGHETGHRVDLASAVTPRRLADQERLAGAQGYADGGVADPSTAHDDGHEFDLERGYVVVTEHELRGWRGWAKRSTLTTVGEGASTREWFKSSAADVNRGSR